MRRVGRFLLASVMVLAAGMPALAAPSKTPSKNTAIPALKNPMIFYLAQGEPNSCGRGCDEWIVAEGEITNGTAERMRAFLKRLGAKANKQPIYFHSPGGVTSESMAMGRLMRERGMTARIARTLPLDCKGEDRDCAAVKRSGRTLVARLSRGACHSACVYTIVGARLREVAPEASLGIHASKTVVMGVPKNIIISAQTRARFKAENLQAIRRYLVEMAIPPGLLDAAEKVPHESIHMLSREEIVRFKIDMRSSVESAWTYEETAREGVFIVKSVEEAGSSPFRRAMLRLSCLSGNLVFDFVRELGPQEDALMPMRLLAASESFELPPSVRSGAKGNDKRYDMRGVVVPVRILETAAAEESIQIEPQPGDGKLASVRLSTFGLASALSSLTRHCDQASATLASALSSLTRHCDQASAGGSALAPRQRP